MPTETVYMVLGPGKWYGSVRIRRWKRRTPKLKADELAFKLVIDIPRGLFDPKTIDVAINEQNMIRPKPSITTQP